MQAVELALFFNTLQSVANNGGENALDYSVCLQKMCIFVINSSGT